MLRLGIVLIPLPLVAVLVSFVAALAGGVGIVGILYSVAKLTQLLVIPGIILVVIGAMRRTENLAALDASFHDGLTQ